jgi:hypothetical protein
MKGYYITQERIAALMAGWKSENKAALRAKMEKLGINKGGFLSTHEENLQLYKYLIKAD